MWQNFLPPKLMFQHCCQRVSTADWAFFGCLWGFRLGHSDLESCGSWTCSSSKKSCKFTCNSSVYRPHAVTVGRRGIFLCLSQWNIRNSLMTFLLMHAQRLFWRKTSSVSKATVVCCHLQLPTWDKALSLPLSLSVSPPLFAGTC